MLVGEPPAERVPGMTGSVDYSLSRSGQQAAIRVNLATMTRDLMWRDLARDSAMHDLVVGPENTFAPRLSPDGAWVAYFVGDAANGEVFVTPFPGPGASHQVSIGGGYGPVWSPDGHRLYYQAGQRLVAATIATTPRFSVIRREDVAGVAVDPAGGYHANFDVMPNGRGFVFPRRTDAPPTWLVTQAWSQSVLSRLRPVSSRR